MNFEQWFKKSDIHDKSFYTVKEGWEACKNEVLKILKEKSQIHIDDNDNEYIEMNINVIEEINNL